MRRRGFWVRCGLLAAPFALGAAVAWAQEAAPPLATSLPSQPTPAEAPAQPGDQPGVEVLTRGPVHEAFAALAADPQPSELLDKKPPAPIEEMAPTDKPEGNVTWIKGYWAYDDDRKDYLWVSGVWRAAPPGKEWVPGYWREEGDKAQWVAGFWTAAAKDNGAQQVTYLPAPPQTPEVAPPAKPPGEDTFFTPGHWEWNGERYVWQAGYWGRIQPGYVWVPGHYRWTPGGYLYIGGYWDLAVSRRGVLYAPVYIRPGVVTVSFSYTPAYAVHDTLVVDTLWVRPSRCSYYFGDYYEDRYRGDGGYVSCVVYSRGHYDSIIVYERYEHRREPDWFEVRVRCYDDRCRYPERRPPRTLVEQRVLVQKNVTINNYRMVAPAAQVAAAKGQKVVPVAAHERVEAVRHAEAVQHAAVQRTQTEVRRSPEAMARPHVASLAAPPGRAVAAPVAAPHTTVAPPATSTQTGAHTVAPPPHPYGGGSTATLPSGKQPLGPATQPPAKQPPPPPARRPPPSDKDKDKDKDKQHS